MSFAELIFGNLLREMRAERRLMSRYAGPSSAHTTGSVSTPARRSPAAGSNRDGFGVKCLTPGSFMTLGTSLRCSAAALVAAWCACSCGAPERRPTTPQSARVTELLHQAGPGVRDCGEALEARDETQCRVKPVGACVESALKDCRPGHGVRSYFTLEGDSVRVDWLVLSAGSGGGGGGGGGGE